MFPKKLHQLIENRKKAKSIRSLSENTDLVDFSSNDYLGFAKSEEIYDAAHHLLKNQHFKHNGATGSRLLSGNHTLYGLVEKQISEFHNSESALIFKSGYDANIGFFSAVPQRGDIIIYDELIHASIRDGLKMTLAKHYKFKHNDLKDLEGLLKRHSAKTVETSTCLYVVTESVFSMDGDQPDLIAVSNLCAHYQAFLVVDEAHAVGVFGKHGAGLAHHSNLSNAIFARIVTFGKSLGCHGAAILCSDQLRLFLINYSRSFIYTTALTPHTLASVHASYKFLENEKGYLQLVSLRENIEHFKVEIDRYGLSQYFIKSHSAIQCCLISGNDNVKEISAKIRNNGIDVRAILSPTVPSGKERLRFCIHAYNTKKEISEVLTLLSTFVSQ